MRVFDGVSRGIPQQHKHLRAHMNGWNHHAITGNDGNGLGLKDSHAGQASSNYKNAQHKSGKSHFFTS